ncbi:MAG: tRNA (adenosine(37)-N6)-threonylcarbamoyltransferase complex transferase subunit TsaD [Pirellulaceae bacterium]|nr:tRNA (adenosine(37)-N6)-threonylcarbamoyltransferase complex transferase subunit TsaD [Planctomycetales bacterium]
MALQSKTKPKKILVIESTCDETAAAIVDEQLHVYGSVVASQEHLHEKFRGVVPEIAARAHVERIIPVIDETLQRSGLTLADIDAVGVANTPGLAGSLLIGLVAAKTLAMTLNVPLIAINHLHAHIYACRIASGRDIFPCVGLVVSGGHTHLYRCQSGATFELLGGTIDDAAGEAFDKVANMLRLPFPGGPALSQLAEQGNPAAHRFPRSFLSEPDRLQFSFSGLKTAVRYAITGPGGADPTQVELSWQQQADLAASFQEAVVDCLVDKSLRALQITKLNRLCIGGGVAANKRLRQRITEECHSDGIELMIAPMALCTDNAVMGGLAVEHLQAGKFADLDLDITAGLVR